MTAFEAVVTISGRKHWQWRAIDQDGYLLDEIVQNRPIPKQLSDADIRSLHGNFMNLSW